ncbi:hypothetical protein OMW55_02225 [Sphingomonas sp. BN140010]|uniref:Glutaredoxin n=1 Tax=Sphingomonas arvum TaxID=2992113 RepID=A0ABT3JC25_9SPHN|nr:hypothetical protein [Sphingomonas sp. BN140010]
MSDIATILSLRKGDAYRMVMPHHTCPYGLRAKDLLKRSDYEVEDQSQVSVEKIAEWHLLRSGRQP